MSFLTKGVRLLSMMIMVRFYDQASFGRFALLIATTELFRVLSDFGIDITTTKWFLDPKKLKEDVARASAVLKLGLALVAAIAVIAGARLLGYSGDLFWGIIVGSISYPIVSLGNLWKAEHQANLTMARLIWPSFAIAVLYLSGFTAGVYLGLSLAGLMGVSVAGDGLMLLFLAKGRLSPRLWTGSWTLVKQLFVSSLPIGLLGMFVVAYARVSTIILAGFLGDAVVGQYSAALRLAEGVLITGSAFASSMLTVFTENFHRDNGKEMLGPLISNSVRKLAAAIIGVALILNLFSRQILGLLFTRDYEVAHQALAALSWSVVFASINMLLTNILFAYERQKIVLWVSALNCVLNVALNLILIPRFGILGAALATVLTELVNTIEQSSAVVYVSGIRLWQITSPSTTGRLGLWLLALLCLNVLLPQGVPFAIAGVFVLGYVAHTLLCRDFSLREVRQAAVSFVSLGMK
jgi:O-antigen/teichoic acid export membrane protein